MAVVGMVGQGQAGSNLTGGLRLTPAASAG